MKTLQSMTHALLFMMLYFVSIPLEAAIGVLPPTEQSAILSAEHVLASSSQFNSAEIPEAYDPLTFCRGEPIEMFATHNSCGRWRLVLAWSISINPAISRSEDEFGRILQSQKYRYPFDRPQVEPEQFYPQPRGVRGDPISRSALVCVRRSDLSSKDSLSWINGSVNASVLHLVC